MIIFAVLFALNLMFAVTPPYGWMTVVNGVCAVVALALMAAETSR